MTTEMKAKIAAMQTKRAAWTIRQNDNGTWSHHKDVDCEWASRDACETDLRFANEWAAA